MMRTIAAYLAACVATFVTASGFYTQQVLARQAEIGAVYTPEQTAATYVDNFVGLAPSYGLVLSIGLLIAFPVAAFLRRVLKPLAPIGYPLAGAAAVLTAIYIIEEVVAGGGVGALAGARGALGLGLQALAGALGGLVFALIMKR